MDLLSCSPSKAHLGFPQSNIQRAYWVSFLVIDILSGTVMCLGLSSYLIPAYGVAPAYVLMVLSSFILLALSTRYSADKECPLPEKEEVRRHKNKELGEGIMGLSNEILGCVFEKLPPIDLYHARGVCTTFKECAEDEHLWEAHAKRFNENLGPMPQLFSSVTIPRLRYIRKSWMTGWVEAQKENQLSVQVGTYFTIHEGNLYRHFPQEGHFDSVSCAGDYLKKKLPVTFTNAQWCFSLNGNKGLASNGTGLFSFNLDSSQLQIIPLSFAEEMGEITALHLGDNNKLFIGYARGSIQVWDFIEGAYQLNRSLPFTMDEKIIEIRVKGDWLIFITEQAEGIRSIYGFNLPCNKRCKFPSNDKKSLCFDLNEKYLVVGNDDRIVIFDLYFSSENDSMPWIHREFYFAEIHALEIHGEILNIAFSKKIVGVDENGNGRWVTPRSSDLFAKKNSPKYIPLSLFYCSLNPFIDEYLDAKETAFPSPPIQDN